MGGLIGIDRLRDLQNLGTLEHTLVNSLHSSISWVFLPISSGRKQGRCTKPTVETLDIKCSGDRCPRFVSSWGLPMKFLRCVVIFGLLSLSSYVAMADGVGDPRMTPIGGGNSTVLTSPTDPAFVISYTAGVTPTVGCGTFDGSLSDNTCIDPHSTDFINNSGVAWKAIQFDITSVAGDITQSSFSAIQDPAVDPYFLFASTTTNAAGDTILSFFGTDSTHLASCLPRAATVTCAQDLSSMIPAYHCLILEFSSMSTMR